MVPIVPSEIPLHRQHESNCSFKFDFRRVYWNSRLHSEHDRLIQLFKPEDVVADVFAGVGPFSLPAAKKGCGVLANDLNPESYKYLQENIENNKVTGFVVRLFWSDVYLRSRSRSWFELLVKTVENLFERRRCECLKTLFLVLYLI
jgi:tRNA G37 N-methylase Trm5